MLTHGIAKEEQKKMLKNFSPAECSTNFALKLMVDELVRDEIRKRKTYLLTKATAKTKGNFA